MSAHTLKDAEIHWKKKTDSVQTNVHKFQWVLPNIKQEDSKC